MRKWRQLYKWKWWISMRMWTETLWKILPKRFVIFRDPIVVTSPRPMFWIAMAMVHVIHKMRQESSSRFLQFHCSTSSKLVWLLGGKCYTWLLVTLSENFCVGNPCQNGGVCENGKEGPKCECPRGYEGTLCEEGRRAWTNLICSPWCLPNSVALCSRDSICQHDNPSIRR